MGPQVSTEHWTMFEGVLRQGGAQALETLLAVERDFAHTVADLTVRRDVDLTQVLDTCAHVTLIG